MGRKAKFAEEKVKKGPGKKTKKQKDPSFPSAIATTDDEEPKKLSHRQKLRLRRRLLRREARKQFLKELKTKKKEKIEAQKRMMNGLKRDTKTDDSETGSKMKGFHDDNSSWLKPKKKKLLPDEDNEDDEDEEMDVDSQEENGSEVDDSEMEDSDDDGVKKDSGFSTDSDDASDDSSDDQDDSNADEDDDDDLLPFEKAAKKTKKKHAKEAKLAAEEEKEMNADHSSEVFQFPSEEELQQQLPIPEVEQRIRDNLMVLTNFKKFREEGRSRTDYMNLLLRDLCNYFSYNEFMMKKILNLFSLHEVMNFLEASETPRPLTIRTNSLKTSRRDLAQALIGRGANVDPIGKWSKVGLVVFSSQVPIGATPEYLAGHYMIQGAASMLPVMALAPKENERILDMCAAPGGKASHIGAIMKNTGALFANDVNKDRAKAVAANFHRLGITNGVISTLDGRKYPSIMKGFDRVLVDAPCSGSGVASKDPSVKSSKDHSDIQRCFNLQQDLLLAAIDCTNAKSPTGGYIIYSTCSILPEENELVIQKILAKRHVKLVETGLDFGNEGFTKFLAHRFHPSMKLARRFYPHTHNMDGFFVAKLKKISDKIPTTDVEEMDEDEERWFMNENPDYILP
ncbi:unnamed protein product [Bemisia tabaci]|uniref:SAM-dependent MTase RsmB/NOP-type domain-containing protein n=1 Tax=Bemisia tabaci TaxID=7038 RepID=A0A9P0F7C4_BEMTA|nr:unnamed protein product [Bemisia tabaci]